MSPVFSSTMIDIPRHLFGRPKSVISYALARSFLTWIPASVLDEPPAMSSVYVEVMVYPSSEWWIRIQGSALWCCALSHRYFCTTKTQLREIIGFLIPLAKMLVLMKGTEP
jgi:hypothetical protein